MYSDNTSIIKYLAKSKAYILRIKINQKLKIIQNTKYS